MKRDLWKEKNSVLEASTHAVAETGAAADGISGQATCNIRKENPLSRRNGNRSRFDRQRKAKLQNRVHIREFRKSLKLNAGNAEAKSRAQSKAATERTKG